MNEYDLNRCNEQGLSLSMWKQPDLYWPIPFNMVVISNLSLTTINYQ